MSLGIDTLSPALAQLVAGRKNTAVLPLDSTATKAIGQALEYDPTGHNYVNKTTSGVGKPPYAICAESSDSVADGSFLCIVGPSDVFKDALDATSKSDADIDAALLSSGIAAKADGHA